VETSFLALYRCATVSGARIVALSADPQLVRDFAGRLLESPSEHPEKSDSPATGNKERPAVRLVRNEHQSTDTHAGDTR